MEDSPPQLEKRVDEDPPPSGTIPLSPGLTRRGEEERRIEHENDEIAKQRQQLSEQGRRLAEKEETIKKNWGSMCFPKLTVTQAPIDIEKGIKHRVDLETPLNRLSRELGAEGNGQDHATRKNHTASKKLT